MSVKFCHIAFVFYISFFILFLGGSRGLEKTA